MDESEVREYVEQSESILEDDPQMGEPNTRAKIIRPLIDLLGWDILTEVELEYPVQIGVNTIKSDYAFLLEDTPVLMAEAKTCTQELTDDDVNQLRSYMEGESVDLGLLTNGRQFRILHRQNARDKPQVASTLSLEQLADNVEILQSLSKEFIENEKWEDILDGVKSKKQAIEALRSDKETMAEKVMQALTSEVSGLRAHEIESESKEFIDYLVNSVEPDSEGILGDNEFDGEDEVEKNYMIILADNEGQYRKLGGEYQYTAMGNVISYLIEKHGLLDKIELPYVPRGERAVLNDEPTHPDEQEMKQVLELSDGTYLNYAINKPNKRDDIGELTNICDFTVYYGGRW
jgi:predicted type IV restriction endonuclease